MKSFLQAAAEQFEGNTLSSFPLGEGSVLYPNLRNIVLYPHEVDRIYPKGRDIIAEWSDGIVAAVATCCTETLATDLARILANDHEHLRSLTVSPEDLP